MKIVTICHSHPDFTRGGGEIAAYRAHQALCAHGHEAYFVSSLPADKSEYRHLAARQRHLQPNVGEFVLLGNTTTPWGLTSTDKRQAQSLVDLLNRLDADVYHFHHIWNIGIDVVERVMERQPNAVFALTLHEFLLMCMNDGQMIRTYDGQLCDRSTNISCAICFPAVHPIHIAARNVRIKKLLCRIDLLIAPSEFLARRFDDWIGSDDAVVVLENGVPDEWARGRDGRRGRGEEESELFSSFCYFGQLTPYKGINIFVRSAQIAKQQNKNLRFSCWGVSREDYEAAYEDEDTSSVDFFGKYNNADAVTLMQQFGWIVMPSLWWENSPVIIQEAAAAGRPMVVSGIGGMKEKVVGWGEVVRPGDSMDLARAFARLGGGPAAWRRCRKNIPVPMTASEHGKSLVELFSGCQLRGRKAGVN